MKPESRIKKILSLLEPDFEVTEKGKQRQLLVGRNESTDYLPLLLQDVPVPEREKYCQPKTPYCQYNFKEQFYDKRKMLFEQLFDLINTAKDKSYAQLGLEAKI